MRSSVETKRHEPGGRRRLSTRLTDELKCELAVAFEAGEATRLELAERYGISRTSVAKVLRGVARATRVARSGVTEARRSVDLHRPNQTHVRPTRPFGAVIHPPNDLTHPWNYTGVTSPVKW